MSRPAELGSGLTYTPATVRLIHFGSPLPEPTPEFTILDEHGLVVPPAKEQTA